MRRFGQRGDGAAGDAAGDHVGQADMREEEADLLAKLALKGKDLAVYSLETVAMFRRDAIQAGYSL